MESPEQCSRVEEEERSSLNEKPEACSRMLTSERSSRVGRVQRERKDRPKRVARQSNIGRRNRKKGAETKGRRTAGRERGSWGGGGGLIVNLKKRGCASFIGPKKPGPSRVFFLLVFSKVLPSASLELPERISFSSFSKLGICKVS